MRVYTKRHEPPARTADERSLELQVNGVPTKIHNVINIKGDLLRLVGRKDAFCNIVLVGILTFGKITRLSNDVSVEDDVLRDLKLHFMDFAVRTGSANANIFGHRNEYNCAARDIDGRRAVD